MQQEVMVQRVFVDFRARLQLQYAPPIKSVATAAAAQARPMHR